MYNDTKLDEDTKIDQLRAQIETLNSEKINYIINIRECQTQISILRSENSQLRLICNEKESYK